MDKATKEYIKRDPEELGFALYMEPQASQEKYRDRKLEETLCGDPDSLETVRCPAIFCHGNHEDFQALADRVGNQKSAPVDFFRRIYYLQSGQITELAGLRIAALGGAKEREDSPAGQPISPYVDPMAAEQLLAEKFDVLLTHCGPFGATLEGSELIQVLIELCQPSYQFYGHHMHPIPPYQIGKTRCYWHADVNFQREHGAYVGSPEPGCMAVLRWNGPEDHQYEVIDAQWFRAITGRTWKYL